MPHKKGRQTRLKFLCTLNVTIILYESPHRLIKSLEEIRDVLGSDRRVCVAREISKMFEEFVTLPVTEAITHYKNKPAKGEIVLIIEGDSTQVKRKSPDKKSKRYQDQKDEEE